MIDEASKAKLRRFMDARRKRDEEAAAAKESEDDYRELEAEIYDDFLKSGVKGSVSVDLGEPYGTVRFQGRETYFGRIIDKEAALEYFEQRALVDEMTTPQISKKRLNELINTIMESDDNTMPPGIDYFARRGMTITQQK